VLTGTVYRADFFKLSAPIESPTNFKRRLLAVRRRNFFFVDPINRLVIRRIGTDAAWAKAPIEL